MKRLTIRSTDDLRHLDVPIETIRDLDVDDRTASNIRGQAPPRPGSLF